MKANAILLTFFAIFITTSCSDKAVEPIQPPEIELEKIVGNWFWLESCGGITGICFDTSGFGSEGISFTKDGIFDRWCDVCYPLPIDYKIEQKTSYFYGPDTIVTAIVFIHEDVTIVDLIIKQLDDNGLTVIEDCGDCYESVYSRIN